MRTLYLEAGSGISGDMTVGALLDLGASREKLEQGLKSLGVDGYHLHFGRARKAGIDAFDFDVHLEEHTHDYDHGHDHGHDHDHRHAHSHGEHVHRNLADVIAIIERGQITVRAKELAIRIFTIVAEAEAKAHGVPVEEVHFHEVGAIDSIVDVVGASILIDDLRPDRILCSPLSEGSGTVRCAHGMMHVPVPAVVHIAEHCSVPLQLTDVQGELVTPTGIAIAAAVAERFERPAVLNIQKVGFGAGNKEVPDRANVLRAYLLEEENGNATDEMLLLETNIDDQTGELLGDAAEQLRELGAADVWMEPIYMKKGRPAQKLCVLCKPAEESVFVQAVFCHTSSIGLRRTLVARHTMNRRFETVETRYGSVIVKVNTYGQICKPTVEFSSAKSAAVSHCVTIEQVITETLAKFWQA